MLRPSIDQPRYDTLPRIESGQTNGVTARTSRSVWDIVRANLFTWFNLILGVLAALMLTYLSQDVALWAKAVAGARRTVFLLVVSRITITQIAAIACGLARAETESLASILHEAPEICA